MRAHLSNMRDLTRAKDENSAAFTTTTNTMASKAQSECDRLRASFGDRGVKVDLIGSLVLSDYEITKQPLGMIPWAPEYPFAESEKTDLISLIKTIWAQWSTTNPVVELFQAGFRERSFGEQNQHGNTALRGSKRMQPASALSLRPLWPTRPWNAIILV